MYDCVMGLTDIEGEGCILADEMGLGKTLQTIALIHTLLSQSLPDIMSRTKLIKQSSLPSRTRRQCESSRWRFCDIRAVASMW